MSVLKKISGLALPTWVIPVVIAAVMSSAWVYHWATVHPLRNALQAEQTLVLQLTAELTAEKIVSNNRRVAVDNILKSAEEEKQRSVLVLREHEVSTREAEQSAARARRELDAALQSSDCANTEISREVRDALYGNRSADANRMCH